MSVQGRWVKVFSATGQLAFEQCFSSLDNPWVPGMHFWGVLVKKTGGWKALGEFQRTISHVLDSVPGSAPGKPGNHGADEFVVRVAPADELFYTRRNHITLLEMRDHGRC